MAALTVRTTRPLSTSAEVVLRPTGCLDDGSDPGLRSAISFVIERTGGPIVLDCAGLTDVADGREQTFEWFAEEAALVGRVPVLRHVLADVEQLLDRTGTRERFELAASAS